ncbi:MAG: exopolysaccharide biosynthesis polyprenyl glycosylphosphotransferase [Acidimicrobiales bacterium]|nr:exopolysaccharide biosynthesis polyprenyl glycosylphosphotransferase [Acidimicrobiales bacterium]
MQAVPVDGLEMVAGLQGRVEAAAFIAGSLLAVLLLGGPVPAAASASAFLAGWFLSAQTVRRRSTLIVGRDAFCHETRAWARMHRRHHVQWVVDGPADAVAYSPLPRCDEVVVDGSILIELRRWAPEVFECAEHVRVVPTGATVASALADPLCYLERCFKRALDVIVASTVLVGVLPTLLIAMFAVWLEDGRSPIFTQTRLGAEGRRFRLYKLRTMTAVNDPADIAYLQALTRGEVTPGEDGLFKPPTAQVTRVGRVLRRFSIDEVPQLFNVLKGDMSVVGPRPPMTHEAEVYDDHSWQRLRVKPGLTGLSQVNGRSSRRFDEIVAMDLAYCEHWSPAMELNILAKTPFAVLSATGAG